MLPDKILQSSLLDIIFENRNKDYGAYILRNQYNKRLLISTTLMIGIVLMFVLLQSFHTNKTIKYITQVSIAPEKTLSNYVKPETKKPAIKQLIKPKQFKTINYQAVQIVKIKVGHKIADIKEIENNMISTQTQSGIDAQPEEMVKPTENSGNSNSITAAVASIPIDLNMIYNLAEIMPQFPGGEKALSNYIADNLQNLAQLDEGEKLIIVVNFVVNKDGSISNISTVPESASMVREVKKVIAKMPQWIPGMQNGHKVSVLFKLPITFAGSE